MLIDSLKKDNMQALKEKDHPTRAILSVVINRFTQLAIEFKAQGKEIQDSDLLTLIQKICKELEDEKNGYKTVNNLVEVEQISLQEKAIKKYLPTLMSEEEIRNIINNLEDKSLPSVMKHFKINYAGKVDMSVVSKIAREQ